MACKHIRGKGQCYKCGGKVPKLGDGGFPLKTTGPRETPKQEDYSGGDAVIKSKLAYGNEFGNVAAQRATSANPNTYDFGNGTTGTHYMSSYGNYAIPELQEVNGKMEWLDNPKAGTEKMKFDSEADARYFAENYKDHAPMMKNYKANGGWLEQYPDGGIVKPYVAKDQEDFNYRNQMYSDSSNAYNQSQHLFELQKQYDYVDHSGKDISRGELGRLIEKHNPEEDRYQMPAGRVATKSTGEGQSNDLRLKDIDKLKVKPISYSPDYGFDSAYQSIPDPDDLLRDYIARFKKPTQKVIWAPPSPAPDKFSLSKIEEKDVDLNFDKINLQYAVEDGTAHDEYVRLTDIADYERYHGGNNFASMNLPGEASKGISYEEYKNYFLKKGKYAKDTRVTDSFKYGGWLDSFDEGGHVHPHEKEERKSTKDIYLEGSEKELKKKYGEDIHYDRYGVDNDGPYVKDTGIKNAFYLDALKELPNWRENLGNLYTGDGYGTPTGEIISTVLGQGPNHHKNVENWTKDAIKEQDAFREYLKVGQRYNTFSPSTYMDDAKSIEGYTKNFPDTLPPQHIIDLIGDYATQKPLHSNPNVKKYLKNDGPYDNKMDSKEELLIKKAYEEMKPYDDMVMGKHRVNKKEDDSGTYLEYYDEWDLDPGRHFNEEYDISPESTLGKNIDYAGRLLEKVVFDPFKIYGRQYYEDDGKGNMIKVKKTPLEDPGGLDYSYKTVPVDNVKTNINIPKQANGGWLDSYEDGGEIGHIHEGDKVMYNTPAYRKAYNEGKIATQGNGMLYAPDLPVFEVNATAQETNKDGSVRYPFYDRLTKEEQSYIDDTSPIGSAMRAKAEQGYGYDGRPSLQQSNLDFAKDFALMPASLGLNALGMPQAAMIEGIEGLRGNKTNWSNILPTPAFRDNKQRLPSDTFLKDSHPAAQLAGDMILDPVNVVGAGMVLKAGLSAKLPVQTILKNVSKELGSEAVLGIDQLAKAGVTGVKKLKKVASTTYPLKIAENAIKKSDYAIEKGVDIAKQSIKEVKQKLKSKKNLKNVYKKDTQKSGWYSEIQPDGTTKQVRYNKDGSKREPWETAYEDPNSVLLHDDPVPILDNNTLEEIPNEIKIDDDGIEWELMSSEDKIKEDEILKHWQESKNIYPDGIDGYTNSDDPIVQYMANLTEKEADKLFKDLPGGHFYRNLLGQKTYNKYQKNMMIDYRRDSKPFTGRDFMSTTENYEDHISRLISYGNRKGFNTSEGLVRMDKRALAKIDEELIKAGLPVGSENPKDIKKILPNLDKDTKKLLRESWTNARKEQQSLEADFEAAIKKYKNKGEAFSAVRHTDEDIAGQIVDGIYEPGSFISASRGKGKPEFGKNRIMFDVPEGQSYMKTESIMREREIVLPKHLQYRVKNTYANNELGGTDYIMEIVNKYQDGGWLDTY